MIIIQHPVVAYKSYCLIDEGLKKNRNSSFNAFSNNLLLISRKLSTNESIQFTSSMLSLQHHKLGV